VSIVISALLAGVSLVGGLVVSLIMLAVARLHIDFEEEQLRIHLGLEWER
jgi:hypothetical protein